MQPQRSGPFRYVPINRRPTITWPNGARLALWVIPNVETFPLNEPVPGGTGLAPDVVDWAPRDYGNRVGICRMMEGMAGQGRAEPSRSTPRGATVMLGSWGMPARAAGSAWGRR